MTDNELFTIVVVGSMNHAIHHPYWYEGRGLISTEEKDLALKHLDSIFIPDLSQFSTDEISILCHSSRWEVKTEKRDNIDRIVDIAARVFDDILPHTPVSACGFNFISVREFPRDGGAILSTVLSKGPVNFGNSIASVELKFRDPIIGNRMDSMVVAPAGKGSIRFAGNINHSFEQQAKDQGKPFELRQTLLLFRDRLSEFDARVNQISDQLRPYAD